MNLQEIKQAVDEGKKVYWKSLLYEVIKTKFGEYLIRCSNGYANGLTWSDNTTLSGKEEDFFCPSNDK